MQQNQSLLLNPPFPSIFDINSWFFVLALSHSSTFESKAHVSWQKEMLQFINTNSSLLLTK